MRVQAQISIYPLKTDTLSVPVDEFCRDLKNRGLEVETQTMSSFVTGESQIVFDAVRQAFQRLAEKYDVVMDLKVSNACPQQVEKKNFKRE